MDHKGSTPIKSGPKSISHYRRRGLLNFGPILIEPIPDNLSRYTERFTSCEVNVIINVELPSLGL